LTDRELTICCSCSVGVAQSSSNPGTTTTVLLHRDRVTARLATSAVTTAHVTAATPPKATANHYAFPIDPYLLTRSCARGASYSSPPTRALER
jgi:hypothetical protein